MKGEEGKHGGDFNGGGGMEGYPEGAGAGEINNTKDV